MVCPYCHHRDTTVTNSRQHREQPRIWRRRQCSRCKTTFTTYESVAEKELPLVVDPQKKKPVTFSMPKLLISIYECLPADNTHRADDAQALAMSVYHELSERTEAELERKAISMTAYEVITRYNARSGLSYGVAHGLITPETMSRR